jgi:hypothetical protein
LPPGIVGPVAEGRTDFGVAAFTQEDVEDARRRRPNVDLSGYAASRGLEYVGSGIANGFRATTAAWPEYIFNSMRGVLAGGEFGLVQHELQEFPVEETGRFEGISGSFFGVSYTRKSSLLSFLGIWERGRKNEPFPGSAVYVPITKAVVRLPEAALTPRMRVLRDDRLPASTTVKLEEYGLPGYLLAWTELWPDDVIRALFGGAVGAVLAEVEYPYVELQIAEATVALACNGYLRDEAALDRLADRACRIAQGVRDVARAWWSPRPFDEPLPPVPPYRQPESEIEIYSQQVRPQFEQLAGELGLTLEDPVEYHRAFPRVPIPSVALAVMRGQIPGSSATGRIVAHSAGEFGAHIGGLLLPARSDAPPTQRGGSRVELDGALPMLGEALDGIAAAWTGYRTSGALAADQLVPRALETMRRLELADV